MWDYIKVTTNLPLKEEANHRLTANEFPDSPERRKKGFYKYDAILGFMNWLIGRAYWVVDKSDKNKPKHYFISVSSWDEWKKNNPNREVQNLTFADFIKRVPSQVRNPPTHTVPRPVSNGGKPAAPVVTTQTPPPVTKTATPTPITVSTSTEPSTDSTTAPATTTSTTQPPAPFKPPAGFDPNNVSQVVDNLKASDDYNWTKTLTDKQVSDTLSSLTPTEQMCRALLIGADGKTRASLLRSEGNIHKLAPGLTSEDWKIAFKGHPALITKISFKDFDAKTKANLMDAYNEALTEDFIQRMGQVPLQRLYNLAPEHPAAWETHLTAGQRQNLGLKAATPSQPAPITHPADFNPDVEDHVIDRLKASNNYAWTKSLTDAQIIKTLGYFNLVNPTDTMRRTLLTGPDGKTRTGLLTNTPGTFITALSSVFKDNEWKIVFANMKPQEICRIDFRNQNPRASVKALYNATINQAFIDKLGASGDLQLLHLSSPDEHPAWEQYLNDAQRKLLRLPEKPPVKPPAAPSKPSPTAPSASAPSAPSSSAAVPEDVQDKDLKNLNPAQFQAHFNKNRNSLGHWITKDLVTPDQVKALNLENLLGNDNWGARSDLTDAIGSKPALINQFFQRDQIVAVGLNKYLAKADLANASEEDALALLDDFHLRDTLTDAELNQLIQKISDKKKVAPYALSIGAKIDFSKDTQALYDAFFGFNTNPEYYAGIISKYKPQQISHLLPFMDEWKVAYLNKQLVPQLTIPADLSPEKLQRLAENAPIDQLKPEQAALFLPYLKDDQIGALTPEQIVTFTFTTELANKLIALNATGWVQKLLPGKELAQFLGVLDEAHLKIVIPKINPVGIHFNALALPTSDLWVLLLDTHWNNLQEQQRNDILAKCKLTDAQRIDLFNKHWADFTTQQLDLLLLEAPLTKEIIDILFPFVGKQREQLIPKFSIPLILRLGRDNLWGAGDANMQHISDAQLPLLPLTADILADRNKNLYLSVGGFHWLMDKTHPAEYQRRLALLKDEQRDALQHLIKKHAFH